MAVRPCAHGNGAIEALAIERLVGEGLLLRAAPSMLSLGKLLTGKSTVLLGGKAGPAVSAATHRKGLSAVSVTASASECLSMVAVTASTHVECLGAVSVSASTHHNCVAVPATAAAVGKCLRMALLARKAAAMAVASTWTSAGKHRGEAAVAVTTATSDKHWGKAPAAVTVASATAASDHRGKSAAAVASATAASKCGRAAAVRSTASATTMRPTAAATATTVTMARPREGRRRNRQSGNASCEE
jgi:hypothetical protein